MKLPNLIDRILDRVGRLLKVKRLLNDFQRESYQSSSGF